MACVLSASSSSCSFSINISPPEFHIFGDVTSQQEAAVNETFCFQRSFYDHPFARQRLKSHRIASVAACMH